MAKLFGTDGVRGRANQYPITAEVSLQLGKAIARVLRASGNGTKRAVIGKDTRLSGYMIESALTSGLVSMGMEVYLVGPMPTPALARLTKSMGAAAGVMITASHNPSADNGIKIFNRDGFKLSDELENEIETLVLGGDINSQDIGNDGIGKAYRIEDARGRYIEFAKNTIGNLNLSGMKIVLDCGNGAAYFLGPLIFKELGAQVTKLGVDPDGYNINLNCGALAIDACRQAVLDQGADLGVALDGDADRVIFVDRHGNTIDGDRILGLLALEMKADDTLNNDTLVTTVMSNLGLKNAMAERGIEVETTAVGDRHIIERMRSGGFTVGGEPSGHIILMDHATTGDGIISALQVMRIMRDRNCYDLSALTNFMDIYPYSLVNIDVEEKVPLTELDDMQAILADCESDLGSTGRHLLRYSGTENKLRILVEADKQQKVDHWSGQILAVAQRVLGA